MSDLNPATRAKVIPIRPVSPAASNGSISQQRLRLGLQLMGEQHRILAALQRFRTEIDADLAVGAQIEPGELTFDRELRIVRPSASRVTRILKVLFGKRDAVFHKEPR